MEDKFVSRSRSTMLTNLPTFRFDSSLQKRKKQENKISVSSLNFSLRNLKMKTLIGDVANTDFDTQKLFHCAERKAFAYGTWTRCF